MIPKQTLKSRKFLFTIILLGIGAAIWIYFQQPRQPLYQGQLQPGKTPAFQITQQLGDPKSTASWHSYQILNYDSDSSWDDQIFIRDEQIALITQMIPRETDITLSTYTQKYGDPPVTLYGPLSPIFNLYVYPSIGFAVVANPDQELLFQLWYFTPMSANQFVTTIAFDQEYTQEEPHDDHEHPPMDILEETEIASPAAE